MLGLSIPVSGKCEFVKVRVVVDGKLKEYARKYHCRIWQVVAPRRAEFLKDFLESELSRSYKRLQYIVVPPTSSCGGRLSSLWFFRTLKLNRSMCSGLDPFLIFHLGEVTDNLFRGMDLS